MSTKKIWILAILFGFIMSLLFLLLTLNQEETNPVNTNDVAEESPEEQETENEGLTVEAGKRAISISVDDVQSVAHAVIPGSIVDVVAVYEEGVAQILLEKIKVLAVGRSFRPPVEGEEAENYETVTLEVTAAEGATLALAKEYSYITLMLREKEDLEITEQNNFSLEPLRREEALNGP